MLPIFAIVRDRENQKATIHGGIFAIFPDRESQEAAIHGRTMGKSAHYLRTKRTTPMPARVISTEPITCALTSAAVQPYC